MASQYPSQLDSFPNPTATDHLENADPALDHATQHASINDAVEALETKVGVTNSNDTSSLDYKVRNGGALRKTVSVTSNSIAPTVGDATQSLAAGKACFALKIQTSAPAWVRIYSTEGHRTDDTARSQTEDALGEHGLLLEVITTADNLTLDLSPVAALYSLEASPGSNLPVHIVNTGSETAAITVTLTVIPLEG